MRLLTMTDNPYQSNHRQDADGKSRRQWMLWAAVMCLVIVFVGMVASVFLVFDAFRDVSNSNAGAPPAEIARGMSEGLARSAILASVCGVFFLPGAVLFGMWLSARRSSRRRESSAWHDGANGTT